MCPPPKTRDLTNGKNDEFTFHSQQKTRFLVLRTQKKTKMTKITQAKPWFAESGGFTTPILVIILSENTL